MVDTSYSNERNSELILQHAKGWSSPEDYARDFVVELKAANSEKMSDQLDYYSISSDDRVLTAIIDVITGHYDDLVQLSDDDQEKIRSNLLEIYKDSFKQEKSLFSSKKSRDPNNLILRKTGGFDLLADFILDFDEKISNALETIKFNNKNAEIVHLLNDKNYPAEDVLSLILDKPKTYFLPAKLSWLDKNPDCTNESVIKLLESCNSDADKLRLMQRWIKNNSEELNRHNFLEQINEFNSYFNSGALIKECLDYGLRCSATDISTVINGVEYNYEKIALAEKWLHNNPDCMVGEVLEVASNFKYSGDNKTLIEKWLDYTPGCSATDISIVINGVEYNYEKIELAEKWLRNNQDCMAGEVLEVASNFECSSYKNKLIEKWLDCNPGCPATDISTVINGIEAHCDKIALVEKWLHNNRDCMAGEVLEAASNFEYSRNKNKLIEKWLDYNPRCSATDISTVINGIMLNHDKIALVEKWLHNNPDCMAVSVLEVASNFKYSADKKILIEKWLDYNPGCSATDISTVSNGIEYNYDKIALVGKWLHNNRDCMADEVLEIASNFEYSGFKNKLIKKWFQYEGNNNADNLIKLIPFVDDKNLRSELVVSFFEQNENPDSSVIIRLSPIIDDTFLHKTTLLSTWLEKSEEETRFDRFVEIVKADIVGASRYNFENIAMLYSRASLGKDDIQPLCRALYPNFEDMQVSLFNEIVKLAHNVRPENPGEVLDTKFIKEFTDSLINNDEILRVLVNAEEFLDLSQTGVLNIIGEILPSKYQSLANTLQDKSINNSLTENGKEYIYNLFGASEENYSLVSLFSYFVIKNEHEILISILKPELLEEIKENFVPSDNSAHISEAEYKVLHRLAQVELPSMRVLTSYLKDRVPEIRELTAQEIDEYQINFDNSPFTDETEENKPSKSEMFRELMRVATPSKEDVSAFVETLLNPEDRINADNSIKLKDLFNKNKAHNVRNEIATLLTIEGGLDKFAGAMYSLGDGCIANVTTNVRTAVYIALIEDPNDQILYSCLSQEIAPKILNSGGDHLQYHGNILDFNIINKSSISPPGFTAKISDEFYSNNKKMRDPWKIIEFALGIEMANEINTLLIDNYPEINDYNKQSSNIASYLVIKNTLPELLESRYLETFNCDNKKLIKDAKQILLSEHIIKKVEIGTPETKVEIETVNQPFIDQPRMV